MKRIVLSLIVLSSILFGANATVYERMLVKALNVGDLSKAQKMIDKGADVNAEVYGEYGSDYLSDNLKTMPYKTFKFLIDHGIKKNKNTHMYTIFTDSIGFSAGYSDDGVDVYQKTKYLVDNKIGITALDTGTYGGNNIALSYMLENKNPNQDFIKAFEYFIKHMSKKDLNKFGKKHWKGYAEKTVSKVKNVKLLKILVDNGLKLNEQWRYLYDGSKYPLDTAVEMKNLDLVKYMIRKGAKVTNSAIEMAQKYRLDDIELYLVEHQK